MARPIFETKSKRKEYYTAFSLAVALAYLIIENFEFKNNFFAMFTIMSISGFEIYLLFFKPKIKIFEKRFELYRGNKFMTLVDYPDVRSCSLYKVLKDNGKFGRSLKYSASVFTRSGFVEFHGKEEYFQLKESISKILNINAVHQSIQLYEKMKIESYNDFENQAIDSYEVSKS